MANFTVKMSPEALSVLNSVKDNCETKRVYVLLDDAGCCGASNAFVTCSGARLNTDNWVPITEEGGISVYANKMFIKTMKEGTFVLDVGDSDGGDSLSRETNYGKRLSVGYRMA